jgi:hypothetical protein
MNFKPALLCVFAAFILCTQAQAEEALDALLARAGQESSAFLDQFSNVKCTEKVQQEKLKPDGKVERDAESTYDYLVILNNSGGELSLNESRLEIHPAKVDRQKASLLVSNGFATLFLVFHPFYSPSFQFSSLGDETLDGKVMHVVAFKHIPGTRTPAALSLRGREYGLELSGKAWIDPQSAAVVRITATIGDSMQDVGLKSMQTEVDYAPVKFQAGSALLRFPVKATVEVETPRQHWRNTHSFSDYQMFSVDTNEKVAANK